MFVKETNVKRAGREYSYLQLVEGYRDETGKVRHRVVANLGRKDALKDSGQLEALAGSFARLDPPMAGTRRSVGPLLVVEHFLRELNVRDTVDGALPRSARSILSVGEVVSALVASRLCSPSPLYDVAGWASGAAVHELLGIPPALLNDDRLGRALETFAVYAEDLRSRVAASAIETFGVAAGRLHVDLTTVGVSGAYEHSALVAKGWASDRRIARQVRALQASTPDGTVLYSRPDPGNAAELTLVGASLERLLKVSGPGLLIVCDSAMGAPKALREINSPACGSSCRYAPVPGSASDFSPTADMTRCERSATSPGAKRTSRPNDGPGFGARCVTGSSPPATTSRRSRCGWRTSTPPRKRPRSLTRANGRSRRPRMRSPGCATDSVAATTRPASRSSGASGRSSAQTSPG